MAVALSVSSAGQGKPAPTNGIRMATAKRIWMAAGIAASLDVRSELRRSERIRMATGVAGGLGGQTGLLWLERDAQDSFTYAKLGVVD